MSKSDQTQVFRPNLCGYIIWAKERVYPHLIFKVTEKLKLSVTYKSFEMIVTIDSDQTYMMYH